LGPLVSPLLTAGLVVVLIVFVLVYREDVRNRLIQLLGTTHLRVTTEALTDAAFRISRYLRTQLVINTCYGLCVGLGLFLIGVPNALLWGVLGLLLRFLPYVGPWLAAAMPLMLSLAVFDDWQHPLLAAGLFVVLELIVSNVLEPWWYGSSIGVSPLGIVFAAVFWTWVWGPVGLVLAVPLTVCLTVASRHLPQLQFVAILFSDQSTMALPDRLYQRLLAWDDDEAAVLARSFLKQGTLDELFDAGLVPTLRLAEADRHAGLLSLSQEAFVMQSVRELADEFGEGVSPPPGNKAPPGEMSERSGHRATGESEPPPAHGCVLCIAVRDEADEIAASMLAQLLAREGFQVDMGSTVVQASELLERTQTQRPDAIVLSIVPPLGSRDGRYLCRRVRAACPDLPILAGLWNGQDLDTARDRLIAAGASHIVTSFREAVATLEALRRS
jgi:methylmalonyl-CoA mutase cobalamin-binding subunit